MCIRDRVKGGSFDRPYSVASDGTIDLERISNRGTVRYTPNRGYFIEEKRPLLQAKTQKDTFLITSVNTGRKENALTLYTSCLLYTSCCQTCVMHLFLLVLMKMKM